MLKYIKYYLLLELNKLLIAERNLFLLLNFFACSSSIKIKFLVFVTISSKYNVITSLQSDLALNTGLSSFVSRIDIKTWDPRVLVL